MIWQITLRELRSLFLSPLAWTLLAVVQFILAWLFFAQIDTFFAFQSQLSVMPNAPGVTDLVVAPTLNSASLILLMITPLLTMRLLSEERRSGTLKLLLSSPVSMTEIVLGKYLGILLFYVIMVALLSLMPLSLEMGTSLDTGKLLAALLGLILILAAFASAGLFISSLTDNPSIAAIGTFGLLIMLWIIDAASGGAGKADEAGTVFTYLSIIKHSLHFMRGIVDTQDISYYLLFIITFILLSIRQMDSQRLQN